MFLREVAAYFCNLSFVWSDGDGVTSTVEKILKVLGGKLGFDLVAIRFGAETLCTIWNICNEKPLNMFSKDAGELFIINTVYFFITSGGGLGEELGRDGGL